MEAGRELDALIAREVMESEPPSDAIYNPGRKEWISEPEMHVEFIWPRRYSTTIAAAWEVVEKLKFDTGRFWFNLKYDNNGIWDAAFCPVGDSDTHFHLHYGNAETAPHAICLAALAAMSPGG